MNIKMRDGLAFINVTLIYQQKVLEIEDVLLDTGSASTIFSYTVLEAAGFELHPDDRLRQIQGVGGVEYVFARQIHRLIMDDFQAIDFEIEVGAMDYGFKINGIVGMDFLVKGGFLIDLVKLKIHSC
jgi:predicted aspartyl protease